MIADAVGKGRMVLIHCGSLNSHRRCVCSLQTPDPSLEDIVLDKMWFTEFAPDTVGT